MMRKILWAAFLMGSFAATGQISVSVTTDQDSINFGDEVVLNYQVNVPDGTEVDALDFSVFKTTANLVYDQYPEELDSIMDIDVVDGGAFKIDNNNLIANTNTLNGSIPLAGSIRVRISSIGAIFLPKPLVQHNSSASTMQLETPLLFIKPVGMAQELNPNFTIIEEEVTWKDYLIYVYVLIGLLAFVSGLYFLIKRVKKDKTEIVEAPVEIKLPADVIAVKELNNLNEKELWQKGETKRYHTELTRIMRQYIEDRYGIQALEMTSSQLNRELSKNGIKADVIHRFNEILTIADKVKFAKGDAGPEINKRFMDESFAIVQETTQSIKDKDEEE